MKLTRNLVSIILVTFGLIFVAIGAYRPNVEIQIKNPNAAWYKPWQSKVKTLPAMSREGGNQLIWIGLTMLGAAMCSTITHLPTKKVVENEKEVKEEIASASHMKPIEVKEKKTVIKDFSGIPTPA